MSDKKFLFEAIDAQRAELCIKGTVGALLFVQRVGRNV